MAVKALGGPCGRVKLSLGLQGMISDSEVLICAVVSVIKICVR